MARTTWHPAPYYYHSGRPDWVFLDGSIDSSPSVETTPSQRRWRVSGTTDSVQKHDLPNKITDYMRSRAQRAGTDVWFEADGNVADALGLHARAAFGGYSFDFTDDVEINFELRSIAPIAFEFVHQTYPLRVILWVVLRTDTYGKTTVSSGLTYRACDPLNPQDHTAYLFPGPSRKWNGAPRANLDVGGVDWELGSESFGTRPRVAAARFLELLQAAQEVDTVSIPDGRDPTGRDTLDFHFSRTNFTQDFYRRVLDIVQSGPAMERLAEHLKGIRRELGNLGIVTSHVEGFDLEALLNGNLSEFQVAIRPQEEDAKNSTKQNAGTDPYHTVHLDLANGVFAVSCTRKNLEEVAEAWNIAKFKAEVAGDTDVLLAYAQAYNNQAERKRLRRIVNERKIPPAARGA